MTRLPRSGRAEQRQTGVVAVALAGARRSGETRADPGGRTGGPICEITTEPACTDSCVEKEASRW
eukprot:356695-Chlamydomonas_euryale.AAC.5